MFCYRLKATWRGVSQKVLEKHQQLNRIMDVSANFRAYRDLLSRTTPPCVPYFGK